MLSSYAGYRTAELEGFSLYGQFHNLWKGYDKYRDTNGKYGGDYDPIADPDGSRVQQLYADLTMIPDTKIRIGRQEILIDDVRFIGNIGWRNNAQAFDAITLVNKSLPDTTIFLGYSENIATVTLEENEFDHIILANVKYEGFKGHAQTVFAYLVDADENETYVGPGVKHDTATYGMRLNGKIDKLGYDFTYAKQTDYEDTEALDLNFFQGSLSYSLGDFTPGIGYSYIEGADQAGGKAFSTLFSTAHKFNGWADAFLGTNAGGVTNGLQDFNASLAYKKWGTLFKVVYHYFDTTENYTQDDAYGQEFDFLVTKSLTDNLKATAKLSYYDEFANSDGGGTADELVFWLRFDYSISGPVSDPLAPFSK